MNLMMKKYLSSIRKPSISNVTFATKSSTLPLALLSTVHRCVYYVCVRESVCVYGKRGDGFFVWYMLEVGICFSFFLE